MAKYQERVGVAAELHQGDFLDSIGGVVGGRQFKRYRVGASVESVWRTEKQRTRMQMKLTRIGEFSLRMDYPVKYRRPVGGQS